VSQVDWQAVAFDAGAAEAVEVVVDAATVDVVVDVVTTSLTNVEDLGLSFKGDGGLVKPRCCCGC